MDGITIHPRYVGRHDPVDICRRHSWVDVDHIGGGTMSREQWIASAVILAVILIGNLGGLIWASSW